MQEAQGPPSSRHWNVASGSSEVNPKTADVSWVMPGGPPESRVSGSVESTVQVWDAGEASTFAAASVALTSKV